MFLAKAALVVAILTGSSALVFGQDSLLQLGEGVKSHEGIDRIYADFSRSYETLDHKLSASLYTENAAYLIPDQEIMTGRVPIEAIFKGFFGQVKSSGRSIAIEFKIVKRSVGENLGYDVGTFEIKSIHEGKATSLGTGKFVVVTERGKDGKWRFAVDGYSNLPTK